MASLTQCRRRGAATRARFALVLPFTLALVGAGYVASASSAPATSNPAGIDWQLSAASPSPAPRPRWASSAASPQATGTVTRAEREGGGQVYEAGWVSKPGWTWRTPFGGGRAAADDEPAVHVTFHEAQAFCRWAGGRLPSDAQWVQAAYTEQRAAPPPPFERGRTYPLPDRRAAQPARSAWTTAARGRARGPSRTARRCCAAMATRGSAARRPA